MPRASSHAGRWPTSTRAPGTPRFNPQPTMERAGSFGSPRSSSLGPVPCRCPGSLVAERARRSDRRPLGPAARSIVGCGGWRQPVAGPEPGGARPSRRPREGVSTTPATATDACSIRSTGYKRKARIYCPRDRGITEIRVASKRPHTPALSVKKAPATAGRGRPAPVKVPLFFSFPREIWSYPATRSGLDAVTD